MSHMEPPVQPKKSWCALSATVIIVAALALVAAIAIPKYQNMIEQYLQSKKKIVVGGDDAEHVPEQATSVKMPEKVVHFSQQIFNASSYSSSLVICIDDTVAEEMLKNMKNDAALLAKEATRVGVCTLTLEAAPVLGEPGAAVADLSRIKSYWRAPDRAFGNCFKKAANVFHQVTNSFKSLVVFTAGVPVDVADSVQHAKFLREKGIRISMVVYGKQQQPVESMPLTQYSEHIHEAATMDVTQFHKNALGKAEFKATSEVTLHAPGSYKNDMKLSFKIVNDKFGADIPARTKFLVKEGNGSLASDIFFGSHKQHFQPFEYVLDKTLRAGEEMVIDVTLKAERDALALSIPPYLKYELVDANNVALLSNTIAMSTDYFLRDIVNKLNKEGEWKVLYIGEFGAGKSTVINNVVSILKQNPEKHQHFRACPDESHCTVRTAAVTVGKLTQIDTIGFANDTYTNMTALTYLLNDWVPRGFVGTNITSIQPDNSIPPVNVAVLVFSVTHRNEAANADALKQIREAAKHAIEKGYSPIYVISHLNKITNKNERAKAYRDACKKIGVAPNQAIPFLQNSDELLRNFEEDLFSLSVLQKIIQRAEEQ